MSKYVTTQPLTMSQAVETHHVSYNAAMLNLLRQNGKAVLTLIGALLTQNTNVYNFTNNSRNPA